MRCAGREGNRYSERGVNMTTKERQKGMETKYTITISRDDVMKSLADVVAEEIFSKLIAENPRLLIILPVVVDRTFEKLIEG